jgi:serine-type D-Ala-D-Ala carboxypeptidase/endopeptidase (penicillin-binding protein 4)
MRPFLLPLCLGLLLVTSGAHAEPASSTRGKTGRAPKARAAAPAPLTLPQALEREVAAARRGIPQMGVAVRELESDTEIYGSSPEQSLILASNTKLVTTAAAIDLLGEAFEFETPLLVRGAVEGGVLRGQLAVVGSGDPNISGRLHDGDALAVFRSWARELKARGIERVEGGVLLVNGLFEPTLIHPDWPRDQLARWYEAPVDALSFSDNCILVRISPGKAPGAPAKVELVPGVDLYRVVSNVVTTGSKGAQGLSVGREPDSREIRVSGRIWSRSGPFETWITVPDPVHYFGAALILALAEEGVVVAGSAEPVTALPDGVWTRVATHKSDLGKTLEIINHRSQNFYAESLLKVLGAHAVQDGSWRAAVGVVEAFLKRMGVEGGFRLADGSGMSRNNRATPREMTRLLRGMYFHPAGASFVRSLPSSGGKEPGWRYRLAQAPYRGNVLAKTGTLSNVSTLSGYAKGRSGKVYAFSILCNTTPVWRAKRAQDAILRTLIDRG